jgi:furin
MYNDRIKNIFFFLNLIFLFLVSHSFGFGLMDATEMVRLARRWKTVPAQHICNVTAQVFEKYVLENKFVFL